MTARRCTLFEHPYVTAKPVAAWFDVEQSTAYRAISQVEDAGILEEVTGKGRNKEYQARESFEGLEQPPQTC